MKPDRKWIVVVFVVVLAGAAWGIRAWRYRHSYNSDLEVRPWAYSADAGAPLLVGRWEGTFTDPGGVEKQIRVEIEVPVTDAEREKKASRRVRNRTGLGSREDKQAFDGTATVTSRLGQELYGIYGSVEKQDFHRFRFHFIPEDEQKRILPNFTAREAGAGQWNGDVLNMALHFTRHEADGSSTSSSEGVVVNGKLEWKESPDEKPVPVEMKRAAR